MNLKKLYRQQLGYEQFLLTQSTMGIAEAWCHSDIRTPCLPWGYPAKDKRISDNPTNNPTKHVPHPDHHNQVRHRNRPLECSPLFDQ